MITGPNIPTRRQRGTAIVLAIVVSVIITGLIMVIAYGAAGLSANGSNLVKCDQTYYAAEAGLNTAIWFAKHNSLSAQTQPLTGSAGGINYSVTWNTTGATTLVTSVASSGTVSGSVHATILGAYLQSSVAYVGGNFDMHNFIVNGDIATAGNITHGGGLDSISGSAFYGGAVDAGSFVTGSEVHLTVPAPTIDFSGVTAQAGLTYNSSQSNKTFDFTAVPGSNKVILVKGNVTNPSFIGTGTLIATGDISITNNTTIGSALIPVNIMSQGNITFTGTTFTLNGSMYAQGNYVYRATTTINGQMVLGGSTVYGPTAKPTSRIVFNGGSKPWFDVRSTSMNVMNIGGIAP